MSKNSRSSSKRQLRATLTASAPSAASPTGGSRPFEREFSPDYSPVVKDLKRIGALAGTFFVILIALSFILK